MRNHISEETSEQLLREGSLQKKSADLIQISAMHSLAGSEGNLALIPLSAASAHEETSIVATPTTVSAQATPTQDATVTALNKENLAQEVQQLKNQNEPDFLGKLQTNATLLSTLLVVIGGLIGLFRWFGDRRSEREKRAEERFQSAVAGLGDEKEGARIGAAIVLRTFLLSGYEQFYTQVFDLAVANLRLPRTTKLSEDPDGLPHPREDSDMPLPLTTLSQALIVIFKEAFPLARKQIEKRHSNLKQVFQRRQKRGTSGGSTGIVELDATTIQLDNAYLNKVDLRQIWMPRASLRKANLINANLSRANLSRTNFSEALMSRANLSRADLSRTNLNKAILRWTNLSLANLSNAILIEASLEDANLTGTLMHNTDLSQATLQRANLNMAILITVNLSKADLHMANLINARLKEVTFTGADLSKAKLCGVKFSKTNIEDALSLKHADLRGVKGLTKKQLAACKAKGAIIDGDPATNASQSTAAPTSPSQSNDTQPSSAPAAQKSTPPPDPDESNTASSQREPRS